MTVLILGGTRGIGRATAFALARDGAKVVATGRTEATAAALRDEAYAHGASIEAFAVDVQQHSEMGALIDDVVARHGALDGLVANAGVSPIFVRSEEVTAAQWDEIFEVNVRSPFFAMQRAARHMLQEGKGSIVFVSSVTAAAGVARSLPYAATKGAVNSLTSALAVEWATRGVRVNAVAPGWIATDMSSALRANEDLSRSFILENVPMNRYGTADEVATAVTYLISDESAFVTGHVLAVDGGFLAS